MASPVRIGSITKPSAKLSMLMAVAAAGSFAPLAHAVTYPSGYQITDRYTLGITVYLQDYATVPKSSGAGTSAQVARVNFLKSDPADANLMMYNDMNGIIYTLDKTTKVSTPYLDFNSNPAAAAIKPLLEFDVGYAAGIVTFAFDPGYANPASPNYGVFYTTITEKNAPSGTAYRTGVLAAWKDTDMSTPGYQGSAPHTMLSVDYVGNSHPMGDIVFDPQGNMFVSSGDGSAGESTANTTRKMDQMLNNNLGKILRLTPNYNGVVVSGQTQYYTVPADNPFVNTTTYPGANPLVYADGFRNPHRISYDAVSGNLIVDDIGLHSYEEVDILHKGANYGYSTIEGVQVLGNPSNNVTSANLPKNLPVTTDGTHTPLVTSVIPTYPAATYSHEDGDAITSGFVYRGTNIPALIGKYVFGDITTGRLFYSDYATMLADDVTNTANAAAYNAGTLTTFTPITAPIHELNVVYNGQSIRIFDLVRTTYDLRDDNIADGDILPGAADGTTAGLLDPYGVAYTGGRSDIRLAMDDSGELFLLSKSDGMIRAILGTNPLSVPEPTALAILSVGAGATLLRRRRQIR